MEEVDTLKYTKGSSCKTESLRAGVVAHKSDGDIATSSIKSACGSPTIVGCNALVTNDVQHQDHHQDSTAGPISGNVSCPFVVTDGKSEKLKITDLNHKSDTQESDGTIRLDADKLTESLIKINDEGWKLFPASLESPQANLEESGQETSQTRNRKKINEAGEKQGKGKRRSKSGCGIENTKEKPEKESTRKISSSATQNKRSTGNTLSKRRKNLGGPFEDKDTPKPADVKVSPTLALFQQPFTDPQQLQLRAQIFVYGALIQGATPDETSMIAAFGETEKDIGKSTWGNIWRMAVQRSHKQESLHAIPEFSPKVHLGVRVAEQDSRESFIQGKSTAFPAGRSGSGSSSSSTSLSNAASSLPSSWSLSTSSHDAIQAGSSLRASFIDSHPSSTPFSLYSSPQLRSLTANANSWPSQISSRVPWMLAPHTPAVHSSTPYAIFSSSEIVQVTPLRDHPIAVTVDETSTGHSASASLGAIVGSPVDANVMAEVRIFSSTSARKSSGEQKPRKRRRNVPSVDSQLLPVQQSKTDSGSPSTKNENNPQTASQITPTASPSPAELSSSVPATSSIQLSSCPVFHVVSTVASGNIPTEVKKIGSTSGWRPSGEKKTRKRRKSMPSVDDQLLLVQQPQMQSGSPTAIIELIPATSSPSTPRVPMDSAASVSKFPCNGPISTSSTALHSSSFNASGVQLHAAVSFPAAHTTVPSDVNKAACTFVHQSSMEKKQRKRGRKAPSVDNQLIPAQKIQQESVIPTVVSECTLATTCPSLRSTPSGSKPHVSEVSYGISISPSSTVVPSSTYQTISSGNTDQTVIFLKETGNQIELAKLQAEDAAEFSASAVKHREEAWSQIARQMNCEIHADIEKGIVSAAVAVSAAASVAKAAAAAAKVAFDAALQAKLITDEVLTMKNMGAGNLITEIPIEGRKRSGKVRPAAMPKRKGKSSTSISLMEPASFAPENEVAVALAATRRAQNMDAIQKVTELAAEAIWQATTVIAMGDPIPLTLNNLLEAGPDCYWTHQHTLGQYPFCVNNVQGGQQSNKSSGECNRLKPKEPFEKDTAQVIHTSGEPYGQSTVNNSELVKSAHQEVAGVETARVRRRRWKAADFTKVTGSTLSSIAEAGSAPALVESAGPEKNVQSDSSEGNLLRQGSLVEVNTNVGGLGPVWLPAKVLEVKGGNFHVCYNDLFSNEGSEQQKEWIPIETACVKPPRIRIVHHVKLEGKRKRGRDNIGKHNWAVGDHVDAWISCGWREGIITDKNKEDETELTVLFQAGGDTSTVEIWNIRSSLFWKDTQWVEWSSGITSWSNEYVNQSPVSFAFLFTNGCESRADVPCEKQQKVEEKFGSYIKIGRGAENLIEISIDDASMEHPKLDSFVLPTKDKPFIVGWSTPENNDPSGGFKRTGLQKGGKKMVLGIPKPGRKTKFVDVSKHYMSEQVAKVGTNDKSECRILPQGFSASHISSKGDADRDGVNNTQSKGFKLGKPQVTRSKLRIKDGSLDPTPSGHEVNPQRQKDIGSFPDASGGQNAARGMQRSDVVSLNLLRLPNRPAYRTNPEETKEIQGQVEELIQKGYVRESLSPCSVANLAETYTALLFLQLFGGIESSVIMATVFSDILHDKP